MLVESLQWCDRSYLARNGNALEQKWLWDFNAYSYESLALLPNPIPCVSLWAKQTRAPMRQNTQGCICWHPASWKLRAQRAGSDDVWWPLRFAIEEWPQPWPFSTWDWRPASSRVFEHGWTHLLLWSLCRLTDLVILFCFVLAQHWRLFLFCPCVSRGRVSNWIFFFFFLEGWGLTLFCSPPFKPPSPVSSLFVSIHAYCGPNPS